MRQYIAICLLAPGLCLAQPRSAPTQPAALAASAQQADVRRAVLDYLEGFYEGDTAKLVRSLRPEMFKYGFFKAKGASNYAGEKMSYDEAIAFARRVKANNRPAPANAPRDIDIYEVQDQTASAKVRAWWGTDYLLLGKYDGKWMISHVLWQGPLPASP